MHQVLGLLSHEHTAFAWAFALRYVYSEQESMNVFKRNVCRDHMFIYIDNFLSLQTELKIMNFCLLVTRSETNVFPFLMSGFLEPCYI